MSDEAINKLTTQVAELTVEVKHLCGTAAAFHADTRQLLSDHDKKIDEAISEQSKLNMRLSIQEDRQDRREKWEKAHWGVIWSAMVALIANAMKGWFTGHNSN